MMAKEGDGEIEVCVCVLEGIVGAIIPPLTVSTSGGMAEKNLGKSRGVYVDTL